MLNDLMVVLTLVLLEGLLSADNALVLAILVRHLPKKQRKKALEYGIIGAFVFRLIAILMAMYLRQYWYFQLIGGLYLLYIAGAHFWRHRGDDSQVKTKVGRGFWHTVVVVELTDIAFSVDSILAAVAMSPKIWVIYTGGVLGIIAMRFVAGGFLTLLDRYSRLVTAAYLLVGWIGLKLCLESIHHPFPGWLFWGVMLILFGQSFLFSEPREKGETSEEMYRKIVNAENSEANNDHSSQSF